LRESAGFSLVEMSVTLLITALVIASIMGGAHLMEAARINKIVTQLSFYKQAFTDFHAKYAAFPGDMPNASEFWNDGTGAIDGDGNNRIDDHDNPVCKTECLRAWQHLGKSGMVNGSYTGVVSPSTSSGYAINGNVPESVIKSAFFFAEYGKLYGRTGNFLQISSGEETGPDEGALPPETARIIDKKTDDADPSAGGVFAARGVSKKAEAVCVTADYETATSAEYDLSNDAETCRVVLWLNAE
jgi:hypothetical protein